MSDKYVIFHIDGGAGKSVLATAVVSSIKNFYPDRKLVVISAWPDIFLHNPLIYRVYKPGLCAYFYEDFIKNKDSIILKHDPYNSGEFINRSEHILDIWCNTFNIPNVCSKPQLFLTQREILNVSNMLAKQGPVLLIQSNGGSEGQNPNYSWARDFPISIIQDIVNTVYKNYNKIIHIRRQDQPQLENTISITDSLRNLMCYTYLSDKFILIDSFIQHVAAAFDKKSLVGWISNLPETFGHQCHVNIVPHIKPSFRHSIDSYMEEHDWTGRRLYECPYDDLDNLFDKQLFLNYLNYE